MTDPYAKALTFLIRRYLSNQRRAKPTTNKRAAATDQISVFNSPQRSERDWSRASLETLLKPQMATRIGPEEDLVIQAKLGTGQMLSTCTVIDILEEGGVAGPSPNIMQQISLEKWKVILKEDLDIGDNDTITYRFCEGQSVIKGDRNLRAAVIDTRDQQHLQVHFTIHGSTAVPGKILRLMGGCQEPINMATSIRLTSNWQFNHGFTYKRTSRARCWEESCRWCRAQERVYC